MEKNVVKHKNGLGPIQGRNTPS